MLNELEKQYKGKKNYYFQDARHELLEFIPKTTKSILDIGCSSGNFGKSIKQNLGCEVWGVEPNKQSFDMAVKNLDKVFFGTIEDVIENIPDKYFDCISFNDVLEHLIDPWSVLSLVKTKLSDSGYILASIPNVRYFKNLQNLLINQNWEYSKDGILDKTHLRFFTKKSMQSMFNECGFSIESINGINPFDSFKYRLFSTLTFNKFVDTKFLQFVILAKPKTQ
jgi:2-polyprenyl-3-methyl-5-hydroxy-6-metoxy-1,4-benzoquinol methylase